MSFQYWKSHRDDVETVAREPRAANAAEVNTSILEAIRAALFAEMARDERVVVFGMDVETLGGVFRVTEGLQQHFGTDRVFDTPLAEGAIVGASVGLAIGGMIPVPEIQFSASPTRPSTRSGRSSRASGPGREAGMRCR